MNSHWSLLLVIWATVSPAMVRAHGRMLDPLSRMSAYLYGYPTPVNYEDHQMYCGGRVVQWQQNGGKCGICGDPWSGPLDYERPNGSKVTKDVIITKVYKENDNIQIVIQITANHLGWFEFRLCDIDTCGGVEATHDCLNQNLLTDSNGQSRFYMSSTGTDFFTFDLVLPAGLTCSHCMMQWKWHCGNDWGCDERGCALGYGEVQEEFYACSDVTILPRNGTFNLSSTNATFTTPSMSTTTPVPATTSTLSISSVSSSLLSLLTTALDSTASTLKSDSNASPSIPTSTAAETTVTATTAATSTASPLPATVKPASTSSVLYLQLIQNLYKNSTLLNSFNSGKINYTQPSPVINNVLANPDFLKMVLGYPNNYNPLNDTLPRTTTLSPSILQLLIRPQTTQPTLLPPTNGLARDRLCAVCYFGCRIEMCTTSCPEICPAKFIG